MQQVVQLIFRNRLKVNNTLEGFYISLENVNKLTKRDYMDIRVRSDTDLKNIIQELRDSVWTTKKEYIVNLDF